MARTETTLAPEKKELPPPQLEMPEALLALLDAASATEHPAGPAVASAMERVSAQADGLLSVQTRHLPKAGVPLWVRTHRPPKAMDSASMATETLGRDRPKPSIDHRAQ